MKTNFYVDSDFDRICYRGDVDNNKKHITMIAATDRQGGIGFENTMPWQIREDFSHFKAMTMGHPVIMGRKTYESLPLDKESGIRLLPGRTNVVVSRDPEFRANLPTHPLLIASDSLDTAIANAGEQQIFIIGGQSIYEQAMSLVDDVLLTWVEGEFKADAFFPLEQLKEQMRILDSTGRLAAQVKSSPEFSFYIYVRKEG